MTAERGPAPEADPSVILSKLEDNIKTGSPKDPAGFVEDAYQLHQSGATKKPEVLGLLQTLGDHAPIRDSVIDFLEQNAETRDIGAIEKYLIVGRDLGMSNNPLIAPLFDSLEQYKKDLEAQQARAAAAAAPARSSPVVAQTSPVTAPVEPAIINPNLEPGQATEIALGALGRAANESAELPEIPPYLRPQREDPRMAQVRELAATNRRLTQKLLMDQLGVNRADAKALIETLNAERERAKQAEVTTGITALEPEEDKSDFRRTSPVVPTVSGTVRLLPMAEDVSEAPAAEEPETSQAPSRRGISIPRPDIKLRSWVTERFRTRTGPPQETTTPQDAEPKVERRISAETARRAEPSIKRPAQALREGASQSNIDTALDEVADQWPDGPEGNGSAFAVAAADMLVDELNKPRRGISIPRPDIKLRSWVADKLKARTRAPQETAVSIFETPEEVRARDLIRKYREETSRPPVKSPFWIKAADSVVRALGNAGDSGQGYFGGIDRTPTQARTPALESPLSTEPQVTPRTGEIERPANIPYNEWLSLNRRERAQAVSQANTVAKPPEEVEQREDPIKWINEADFEELLTRRRELNPEALSRLAEVSPLYLSQLMLDEGLSIAYAASLNLPFTPEDQNLYGNLWDRFDSIWDRSNSSLPDDLTPEIIITEFLEEERQNRREVTKEQFLKALAFGVQDSIRRINRDYKEELDVGAPMEEVQDQLIDLIVARRETDPGALQESKTLYFLAQALKLGARL